MQRSDGGYEQDPTTVPSIHDDQIDMGDDGGAWFAYAPLSAVSGPDPRRKPELADLGRLARRGGNMAARAARVDEQPSVHAIVAAHLGDDLAHDAGIAQQRWAGYESVNMQRAIDAWISAPGRTHQVVGVMMQSPDMGLADLVSGQNMYGMPSPQPTSVSRVNLPCGPGQMQACAVRRLPRERGERPAHRPLRAPGLPAARHRAHECRDRLDGSGRGRGDQRAAARARDAAQLLSGTGALARAGRVRLQRGHVHLP